LERPFYWRGHCIRIDTVYLKKAQGLLRSNSRSNLIHPKLRYIKSYLSSAAGKNFENFGGSLNQKSSFFCAGGENFEYFGRPSHQNSSFFSAAGENFENFGRTLSQKSSFLCAAGENFLNL